MASVQYLFSYTNAISGELQERQIRFSLLTKFRTLCTIVIQKVWRGHHQNQKYQKIRKAIITIQCYCRGWIVRKQKGFYQAQHILDMEMRRTHNGATMIQKHWRGYITRKLMKDNIPKKLIESRKKMIAATNEMRSFIKEQYEANTKENIEIEYEEDMKMILFILFKCHHLIRTKHREGVYSCYLSDKLSSIEEMMKALPLKDYMHDVHTCYEAAMKETENEPMYMFENKMLRKFEDLVKLRDKTHDLVDAPKECLNLSDKPFRFYRHVCKKYEPMLFSSEKYRRPIECVSHNDEIKSKNVSSKAFDLGLKLNVNDKTTPYYVDFWEKHLCCLHYPPEFE